MSEEQPDEGVEIEGPEEPPTNQELLKQESKPTGDVEAGVKGSYSPGEKRRKETWDKPIEFLLMAMGYSIDFGNVYRFPVVVYRNGGGAFFIAYCTLYFTVSLPMIFMESSLGQFLGKNPIEAFRIICPLFEGIGFAIIVLNIWYIITNNLVIAWLYYYLFNSFTTVLPWDTCSNNWNTAKCSSSKWMDKCRRDGLFYYNRTCHPEPLLCNKFGMKFDQEVSARKKTTMCYESASNGSNRHVAFQDLAQHRSATAEYLELKVWGLSSGIHEIGMINYNLAILYLLGFIIIFAIIFKGIRVSSKIVYFSVSFPYVGLCALLMRGLTLDGAMDGIMYFIKPNFDKLFSLQTWGDATTEAIYASGIVFGGFINLASFNKFHHNNKRDAIVVLTMNFLSSVLGGFVIFTFVGFLAKTYKTDIENIVKSGHGLAFVVFPEAITMIQFAPLWSMLFFFTLIMMGIVSIYASVDFIVGSILHRVPALQFYRTQAVGIVCGFCFFAGLILTTNGGPYIFTLLSEFGMGWNILFIGVYEIMAIMYIYNLSNQLKFFEDIRLMLGTPPNQMWIVMWFFITPAIMVILSALGMFTQLVTPFQFGSHYYFPLWAVLIGWALALSSVIMVPLFMFVNVLRALLEQNKDLLSLVKPSSSAALLPRPSQEGERRLGEKGPVRRVLSSIADYVFGPLPEGDEFAAMGFFQRIRQRIRSASEMGVRKPPQPPAAQPPPPPPEEE